MGVELVLVLVPLFLILGLTIKQYRSQVRIIMLAGIALVLIWFIFR